MQIDLQPPLKITKVLQDGEMLIFDNEENAHFIQLSKEQKVGETNSITVYYTLERLGEHLGMVDLVGKKTRVEMIL